MTNTLPFEILLVEDNPGDVDLIRSAVRKLGTRVNLTVCRDGEAALALLRERKGLPPLPDIVLLDLNLPKKRGQDVLRDVKQDVVLRRIPVIVLTSSSAPDDIASAYDLGANSYLTKCFDLDESNRVMKAVEDFWMMAAYLPEPVVSGTS